MKNIFILAGLLFFFSGTLFAEEGVDKDEIRALLGEVYMIEKDYPEAVKKYEEVLRRDPANTKARTELADVLSWQRKYDAAIAEYEQVLKTRPEDLEVQRKLAQVYTWKKDYPKAEALYQTLVARDPENSKKSIALARVFVRQGKFDEAMRVINGVLEQNPQDLDAKVLLAETWAEKKDFKKAIALYREILEQKYDRKVKAQMADVMSWARNYREALNVYEELLAEKDEKEVRLQKARILGWARKYRKATLEYERILRQWPDETIEMEMKAKRFYWDNRVKHAIAAYQDLIRKSPDNVEAMFDLSQIYSYQSMWEEAIGEYEKILDTTPDHFRAKEGLEKARLISGRPVLTSGYEFFKAHSGSRDVDIHKNVFASLLYVPLGMHAGMELGYNFVRRTFRDFHALTENHARVAFHYRNNPAWSAGGFFNLITYHTSVAPVYEFGGRFAFRTFDIGQMILSVEQLRLENNSDVIRRRTMRDDFKARQDLDLTKRWKAGADYTFTYLTDHNYRNEVAGDTLFYLTLEPRAFYVKYRYAFRDFQRRDDFYFAPHNFSLHTISARWRHFLNKEEVFFGANDLYYEAGYDFSMDSTGIISHQVLGSLCWDITKRLQIKGEGQYTHATTKIYEDVAAKGSAKYYF